MSERKQTSGAVTEMRNKQTKMKQKTTKKLEKFLKKRINQSYIAHKEYEEGQIEEIMNN